MHFYLEILQESNPFHKKCDQPKIVTLFFSSNFTEKKITSSFMYCNRLKDVSVSHERSCNGILCANAFRLIYILNSYSHSYLTKSLRLIRLMPYDTVNPLAHITTICALYQQSKYLTPPDLGTTLCRCIDILVVGLKGIKRGAPL